MRRSFSLPRGGGRFGGEGLTGSTEPTLLDELFVRRQGGRYGQVADVQPRGVDERRELIGDRLGGGEADGGILRHHVGDHLGQLLRSPVRRQRLNRFARMPLEFPGDIASRERRLPRNHLVQAASERVDVGLRVGNFAGLLEFGSRVIGAGGERTVGVNGLHRPRPGQLRRVLQQAAMALGVEPKVRRANIGMWQLPTMQLSQGERRMASPATGVTPGDAAHLG